MQSVRLGQLVFLEGGECLGRVAAVAANRLLVDLGDHARWYETDQVSPFGAHALFLPRSRAADEC